MLFVNRLISYTVVYFIVAYIKKYNLDFISVRKNNFILMLIGIIMLFLLQLAVNFIGYRINAVGSRIFHFVTNNNPIILLIGFSVFNIFRGIDFQSKFVNYTASLTILIYIIHDNILFREYVRPVIMFDIWEASGRINIVLLIMICGIALFVISTVIAMLYSKLLQQRVHRVSEKILRSVIRMYDKIEAFIYKI